jgi:hypothetical protein
MKVATNPIEGWTEGQLRLYSVAEACRILGSVGKTWLYSEIAAGKLKPLKLGARTMFTSRELNRYIAARESEQCS